MGAKGVVARGRGCVLMCTRYAASTIAGVVRRPRPTTADRAHGTAGPTDRPAGGSALPCRRVSHSGAWRGGGAVVVGTGPARSALSTTGRGPHAGAGIAPRALRSNGTVPATRSERSPVRRPSFVRLLQSTTNVLAPSSLISPPTFKPYSALMTILLCLLELAVLTPHHINVIFYLIRFFLFSSSVTRVNCRFHRYSRADDHLYYFVFDDFFPLFFLNLIFYHIPTTDI